MKKYLLLCILLMSAAVHAQTSKRELAKMVNEGVDLLKLNLTDEAIEKFNQVIKLDSTYADAYFEIANTFYITPMKKPDALPYLQKLLQVDPKYTAGYDLLGNIYDDIGEADKAIATYEKGMEVNPDYQRLYHNLAVCYYQLEKFADAENYALEAVRLQRDYTSSIRLYALATYKQQKLDRSLLGWCAFLMLENATGRSREANRYISEILSQGIGNTGVNAVTNKDLPTTDSLSLQLTRAFKIIAGTSKDKASEQFNACFGEYFGKLADSGNMPAFTRFITMSVKKDEDQAWLNEHQKELDSLTRWITATKITF